MCSNAARRRIPSPAQAVRKQAFTLIEVLVVVAIIALLIAILIPALNEARDQARSAKCLANMQDMGSAIHTFSTARRGRFQIQTWVDKQTGMDLVGDPQGEIFAYESVPTGTPRYLLGWPLVILREGGNRSLKRNLDWGVICGALGSNVLANRDRIPRFSDVLSCPAEKWQINTFGFPTPNAIDNATEYIYGHLSYGINGDIVGIGTKNVWKDGVRGYNNPPGAGDQLKGRLEQVIRPSEVVIFTDAGIGRLNDPMIGLGQPGAPTSFGTGGNDGQAARGPYIEFVDTGYRAKLRAERHRRGSLNITFVDGHGAFTKKIKGNPLNPTGMDWSGGVYKLLPPVQFVPKVRVSPYNVGIVPSP